MGEKKTETVLLAGHEVSTRNARMVMDTAIPSVRRVVEELVIAGRGSEAVEDAAKTTAKAVVATMAWMINGGN